MPVLLSVGYAACHWCHVMAHESFEDEATAAYLNEHFVSIKVDREERPDVDAVYMQATVAMTGQGGWPMTCVLDHEGRPVLRRHLLPRPAAARPAELRAAAAGDRPTPGSSRRDDIEQHGRADIARAPGVVGVTRRCGADRPDRARGGCGQARR